MFEFSQQTAKEETEPLLLLAAPASVAENSHPGVEGYSGTRIEPRTFVGSTLHWGCTICSYEPASARLDQRYYTAIAGRFYTPDPSTGVDLQNPITWNKYVYAADDPVNFNDRRGLMMDLVDDGGGGGGEWWCEGPWDPLCFGDPGTDPATGVGFAPAPKKGPTLGDERKKRAAAIAEAIAAIAKKLGDQVTNRVWPTAIKLGSMCSQRYRLNNYQLVVTYQVISDLGTPMYGSDLGGFSITESFVSQVGNLGDLNAQRGDPWSLDNGNLRGNGTFRDYLSTGTLPGFPRSGTANQEFTATGWFGTQPLDILGFGDLNIDGVNLNTYSPSAVTVNGLSASQPCGN